MPHVHVEYTNDLTINFSNLFQAIETRVNEIDSTSGDCKSRAYPTAEYRHTHVLVTVSFLKKPHRDETFTKTMTEALEATIKNHLHQSCYVSLLVAYNPPQYITNHYVP